jgi:hypothetical protein
VTRKPPQGEKKTSPQRGKAQQGMVDQRQQPARTGAGHRHGPGIREADRKILGCATNPLCPGYMRYSRRTAHQAAYFSLAARAAAASSSLYALPDHSIS